MDKEKNILSTYIYLAYPNWHASQRGNKNNFKAGPALHVYFMLSSVLL
jgi:hypothetical protein